MMGRPREFDETEALNSAMHVFWLKGYEATSMKDLMKAMDLHKGSIYKAFGDKHQLFMSALGHYMGQGSEGMMRAFDEAPTPKDAVRSFLTMSLRQCACGPTVKGCFMMNSVVELAPHDETVRSFIESFMKSIKGKLSELIAKGQAIGQFRTDREPVELAEYLMFVKAGILTGCKMRLESQDPYGAVELALSAIE